MTDSKNAGADIARRLRIEGRVQGVWYRGWAVDEARHRHLRGWVRNRADGSVEALLIGRENDIESMIEACWNGPSAARVTGVDTEPADDDDSTTFEQVPTR